MHKSTAWPLAALYAALVVYASLFPFVEWRDQGIASWEFLLAPTPRYWTGFDVAVNVAGYVPLGGLVALSALRSGWRRSSVWWAPVGVMLLSLCMEGLQSYLPSRVPSREDFLLNAAGAWVGALAAFVLQKAGAIDRWNQLRSRWFVPHSRGGIVLLSTWPVGLLFPASVPLGLGQVVTRLEALLQSYVEDSSFEAWLPVRDTELLPLAPGTELLCVALGLLIPCLLGFCVVRPVWRRMVVVGVTTGSAILVSALSAALSWGPLHAWAWLDVPAQIGLFTGASLALLFVFASWRASAALALLSLGVYLSLLNQAPESPYFAQTLLLWEQGRFIRFNGLAQWVGWLWPYVASVYLLGQIGRRDAKN
ncbi:VanZ family protein [Rhodoferax mekongensis]|uniref:VanZ family protein n=1 Tax=Rhodoferax mekongensis TaxID=3068341 RepID=A0ABZ0B2K7_9BURK|nr:VanZ family protein [Rhodoferax sp. TBRC 17307]WNO05147.1 VanZ family protein [Rhodoferax sp. TBRC 17307]